MFIVFILKASHIICITVSFSSFIVVNANDLL